MGIDRQLDATYNMSEEDDFLSEESYEFEFEEDDDNEEIQEEQTQENSPVCESRFTLPYEDNPY